jgi:hypothetical protein
MQGEMAEHLGYEKHDPDGNNSGNSRNRATLKTLKGRFRYGGDRDAKMASCLLLLTQARNWNFDTLEREVRMNLPYRDFARF